ncbi:BatD family protein [Thalassotalea agarivorans]|uniref:BatD family protein n=1 Tax=Thalassotalea agarivorans TaxID=349064 RepID=UPI0015A519E8|nr:BatD family protein [Thalassotalea agarivorans]
MITLIFCALSIQAHATTKITATVDQNPAVVNQSLLLEVTADDSLGDKTLDLSALEQDFLVGRTSVSSQTQSINFKTTRKTIWRTVLVPKKVGQFTIPAFEIDGQFSEAFQLSVQAANEASSVANDVFMTVDLSQHDIYVQQQSLLTVRLHLAAELQRGSLSEPIMPNALIEQFGKDTEQQEIIDGKRYNIIERKYLVKPQQSGQYTLTPPLFSGEVMVPSARRGNFLSFNTTKPVSVAGEKIAVTVKPQPSEAQGDWLPSELVILAEEQSEQSTFFVGDPITRKITLTAVGVSQEQLPQINLSLPDGLRAYADQPQITSGTRESRLISQSTTSFAIVALKPGTYTMPAVTIPWWNTITNRQEFATINAQTVTVEASPDIISEVPTTSDETNTVTVIETQAHWLQWLFLALWLATLAAWFFTWYLQRPKSQTVAIKNGTNKPYLALLAALKQQQASQSLQLLLPWLNQVLNSQFVSLAQATAHINDSALNAAIAELEASLYGSNEGSWNSQTLLAQVQKINKVSYAKQEEGTLKINP